MTIDKQKNIVMIAGEASGDMLGAQLISILQKIYPNANYSGVGGNEMRIACPTFNFWFEMDDLSVMGLAEVLPSLPVIMKRLKQAKRLIKKAQPDLVITIDAPDFNNRVAKAIQKHCPNTIFVHYVAPTVWAWRAGRAKKIASIYDGLLCLLPFEPAYFEKEGLPSLFVGHPALTIVGQPFDHVERQNIRQHYHPDQSSVAFISVLFGSRRGEIERHSKIIIQAMKLIKDKNPSALFFIPSFEQYKAMIAEELRSAGFTSDDYYFVATDQRYDLFKISDYAIAVSGTVGLELAIAKTPHCVCYRFGWITALIAKRLIKTPFAHLANILLREPFIPEFIQEDFTAEHIVNDALDALESNRRKCDIFHKKTEFLLDLLTKNDLERELEAFLIKIKQE